MLFLETSGTKNKNDKLNMLKAILKLHQEGKEEEQNTIEERRRGSNKHVKYIWQRKHWRERDKERHRKRKQQ